MKQFLAAAIMFFSSCTAHAVLEYSKKPVTFSVAINRDNSFRLTCRSADEFRALFEKKTDNTHPLQKIFTLSSIQTESGAPDVNSQYLLYDPLDRRIPSGEKGWYKGFVITSEWLEQARNNILALSDSEIDDIKHYFSNKFSWSEKLYYGSQSWNKKDIQTFLLDAINAFEQIMYNTFLKDIRYGIMNIEFDLTVSDKSNLTKSFFALFKAIEQFGFSVGFKTTQIDTIDPEKTFENIKQKLQRFYEWFFATRRGGGEYAEPSAPPFEDYEGE